MSLLLALLFSLVWLAAAGLFVWLLWRFLREQAGMRRALEVQMLQVTLPKDLKPEEKELGVGEQVKEKVAVAEQWLSTLAHLPGSWWDKILYGAPSVVLEIVARNDDTIVFYAGCERRFIDHLEKQIYAHYPDAEVAPAPEFTLFEPGDTIKVGAVTLARSAHLPIATYKELETDPMQTLTGALAKIQKPDSAVIQYVLQAASHKVRKKGTKAAKQTFHGKKSDVGSNGFSGMGGSWQVKEKREKKEQEMARLTPRAQQRVELVEQKASQQLLD